MSACPGPESIAALAKTAAQGRGRPLAPARGAARLKSVRAIAPDAPPRRSRTADGIARAEPRARASPAPAPIVAPTRRVGAGVAAARRGRLGHCERLEQGLGVPGLAPVGASSRTRLRGASTGEVPRRLAAPKSRRARPQARDDRRRSAAAAHRARRSPATALRPRACVPNIAPRTARRAPRRRPRRRPAGWRREDLVERRRRRAPPRARDAARRRRGAAPSAPRRRPCRGAKAERGARASPREVSSPTGRCAAPRGGPRRGRPRSHDGEPTAGADESRPDEVPRDGPDFAPRKRRWRRTGGGVAGRRRGTIARRTVAAAASTNAAAPPPPPPSRLRRRRRRRRRHGRHDRAATRRSGVLRAACRGYAVSQRHPSPRVPLNGRRRRDARARPKSGPDPDAAVAGGGRRSERRRRRSEGP